MNCPNCGAGNIAAANFCRLCGLSFQKLSKPISFNLTPTDLGRAIRKLVFGIGLLIIAFVPLLEGEPMIWWLLFPGIPMVAKGMRLLSQIKKVNCMQNHYQPAANANPTTPVTTRISSDMRARPTGELVPPPSVTENTTRLLEKSKTAVR